VILQSSRHRQGLTIPKPPTTACKSLSARDRAHIVFVLVIDLSHAKAVRLHDGVGFALTGGAFTAPIATMGAAAFLFE